MSGESSHEKHMDETLMSAILLEIITATLPISPGELDVRLEW